MASGATLRARPAPRRIGKQTVQFENPPAIIATGTVVGPLEGKGPLGHLFDHVTKDELLGQKSFERAEQMMLQNAAYTALNKAGLTPEDMDYMLSGDLLNQLITSSFSALAVGVPVFGLYGACATSTEGLGLGAMLLDGGFANHVMVATASHNRTAERQYRYPNEYGFQRKPHAQRTATAAGAAILAQSGEGPRVTLATTGKVVDRGIKDPYNVGAAMAPAAASTILTHLQDTGRRPQDYDLIATGDLALYGHRLLVELGRTEGGIDLEPVLDDCGLMLYGQDQEVGAGASGAGCSAAVTFASILKDMRDGRYKRVLVAATGALHSPCSFQQGEYIPTICHAVSLEV